MLPRVRGERNGGVASAVSRLSRRGRKLPHSDRLIEWRKDRVRDSLTGTPEVERVVEGEEELEGDAGALGCMGEHSTRRSLNSTTRRSSVLNRE
jgi:hypothetical protein